MYKQFEKALNLVKRTGDRLILYNTQSDEDAYAVMSLDEYERIATGKTREVKGLTEEELVDKINRDIAVWKSEQASAQEEEGSELKKEDYWQKKNQKSQPDESGERGDRQEDSRKNYWGIPQDRKKGAAEIIEENEETSAQSDDEDRQYLEEITF